MGSWEGGRDHGKGGGIMGGGVGSWEGGWDNGRGAG